MFKIYLFLYGEKKKALMIKGFYLNPLMHDEAADESKSHGHNGYISINPNLALKFTTSNDFLHSLHVPHLQRDYDFLLWLACAAEGTILHLGPSLIKALRKT